MPKKPRNYAKATVYLDRTDEISSINDKLEGAEGDAVIVVAPRTVRILRTPLYVKLLRRSAEQSGKQIALVAEDWLTRDLARLEGIPVYRSVRAVNGSAFAPRPMPSPLDFDRPAHPLPRRRFRGRLSWLVRGAALVSLIVLILGGVLMVPLATVRIIPDTQDIHEDLLVTASIKTRVPDFSGFQVPGRHVESRVDDVAKQPASGRRAKGDRSATGQVTLTNNSAAVINLPKGFQVQTVDGLKFALVSDLVVPAGGARTAQNVAVQAVEPGVRFNVASFVINRTVDPQFASRLTVVNNDPTGGGADTEVTVVTEDDIAKLRSKAAEKLRKDAIEHLYGSIHPHDESIYAETIDYTITEESLDKQVGDEAKEVGLRMSLVASAVAFSGNDVNSVALRRLAQRVRPGYQVVRDTLRTNPVGLKAYDKESLTFFLSSDLKATPQLDEDSLKRALTNRSPADARDYLSRTLLLAQEPEVVVQPNWLGKVPPFAWRIDLIIVPREG
jgi:hypothetical protein